MISMRGKLNDFKVGKVPRTRKSIIIPAKAGIHNHRALLLGEATATARYHVRRGVWVPAQGRDDNEV